MISGVCGRMSTFCWCSGFKDTFLLPHPLIVRLPCQEIIPPLGGRILAIFLVGVMSSLHG